MSLFRNKIRHHDGVMPAATAPQVTALTEGHLPCGVCGCAVPTAEGQSEIVAVARTDEHGLPKTVATFEVTRCADHAHLRNAWGVLNERLGVAVRLLGYDGKPGDELLTAAGLTTEDASEWPISGLLYSDWVARAVDEVGPHDLVRAELAVHPKLHSEFATIVDGKPRYEVIEATKYESPYAAAVQARAALATTEPFGHITGDTARALRAIQVRNRASLEGGEATKVIAASEAAHLLTRYADHHIITGCIGCGCRALSVRVGTRPEQVWHPVLGPVQTFTRGLRRPGSQVGNFVGLLCPVCHGPVTKQGAAIGEELAHCLLPSEVYSGNPNHYGPGTVAGGLFVAHVLRARILGNSEPEPGRRWDHLKSDGQWQRLPYDDMQAEFAEWGATADGLRSQRAAQAAEKQRVEAEIDRRATAKAREVVKTDKEVAASGQSMTDAVTRHKKLAPRGREMRF